VKNYFFSISVPLLPFACFQNNISPHLKLTNMGMLKEFREFAMKGNIVDLAVAVIIGGAFGKIVTALTETIIMPIISLVMGKGGVQELSVTIGSTVFPIGGFLQAVIDFILVAFVLFLIIKGMNKVIKKKEAAPPATPEDIVLLREIRDALKK
jgi:large conductance mechanosensitive channel